MRKILFALFAALGASSALTIGTRPRQPAPPGNLKLTVTPVTFPTKYTKEGEAFTPANAGLGRVVYGFAVLTGIGTGSINIAHVTYDYTNEKLHLHDETPAEVAEEAEIKGVEALVFAYGS